MQDKEIFRLNLIIDKSYSYLKYHADISLKKSLENLFYTPYSIIRKIEIDNDTDKDYGSLILKFESSSDILSVDDLYLGPIAKRSRYLVKEKLSVHLDEARLLSLKEETRVSLLVKVVANGNTELSSVSRSIHLFPSNMFPFDPFNDAKLLSEFIIPKDESLKCFDKEEDAPVYEGKEKSDVIARLSDALALLRMESLFLRSSCNRKSMYLDIQSPSDTLMKKGGDELDIALLFLSLLSRAGFHPILVLLQNHILVGTFLTDYDSFHDGKETRPSFVYSLCVGEDKSLILLDAQDLIDDDASLGKSAEKAGEYLRAYRNEFIALDIHSLQASCFHPISEDDIALLSQEEQDRLLSYQKEEIKDGEQEDRFSTWEKKLLDLSPANRLVSFTFSENALNHAPVYPGDISLLHQFLKRSNGSIEAMTNITSKEVDGKKVRLTDEEIKENADSKFTNGIVTLFTNASTIKQLVRKDLTSKEETGSPTLYLALGTITGFNPGINPNAPEEKLVAPFLLLPVTVSKDRGSEAYTLKYDFESLMLNKTFFEYYKVRKGISFDYLYFIDPATEYTTLVNELLKNTESDLILDQKKVFLANFSFSHMVMWQDVVRQKDNLRHNTIIRSLLENKSYVENIPLECEHVDDLDQVESFAAPLPYDSTQLKAIRECALGNSFILDGPPGTGKSQTIVNMIVNAFYHGKSVLFVAEKQAALEVVRQRLAQLGLDAFALQLYSPNTNKAAVFSQLAKVMSMGMKTSDEDFHGNCNDIEEEKKKLNEELKKLHSRHGYFYSLYEAITKKLANDDCSLKLHFDDGFVKNYDGSKDDDIRNTLNFLSTYLEKYNSMEEGRYLSYLRLNHLSYQEQIDIAPTFEKVFEGFDSLKKNYQSFQSAIHEKDKPGRRDFENILSFYDYVLVKDIKEELVTDPQYFKKADDIIIALTKREELKKLYPQIKNRYRFDKISSTDGEAALRELKKGTNIFNRPKARKNAVSFLKDMLLDTKIKEDEIEDAARTSIQVNSLLKDITPYQDLLLKFFKEDILADLEKEDSYLSTYEDYHKFHQLLSKGTIHDYIDKFKIASSILPLDRERIINLFLSLKKSYEDYLALTKEAKQKFPYEEHLLGLRDYFEENNEFYSFLIGDKAQRALYDFARINAAYDRLSFYHLDEFSKAIEKGKLGTDEILKAYDWALATSFIAVYFINDSFNDDFDEASYNKTIEKYQESIRRYNSLSVGETIEKVTRRFTDPNLERSKDSPIGALRKLVMNSGRGISIRNLLSKYEDLIRMYFPCFLMSPLSCAQYLDVTSKKFDVVIFDEASQIPTSEAIGPIARANSLIVAGDPQQMPPSNYFNISYNNVSEDLNGDKALIEDAESLLDDALAIQMPRIRLAFHYRSRHESLIQFSNMNFYGGDLFTFPSVDNKTSHISFLHVDATTKKKSGDISKEEIDAILGILKKILDDKHSDGKSIGIIVFNSRQQAKLNDEVDNFILRHPKYIAKTHYNEEGSTERLFVKNLENVQGDERDIIIMSIGFAKNPTTSKAFINGPLTLEKGERRLNVAASRSKEQMIVVSTLYSSEIDTDNRTGNGAKALKEFLAFAENASLPARDEIIDSPNKDLTYFIARELQGRGYECDVSVGSSEFKIDIAVRRKDSDEYLLGILLDEKPLNSNISCRDRFYVEPVVLSSLHWKLLRVYTYSFLRFKDDTIESIIKAIESAKNENRTDYEKFVPPIMTEHPVLINDETLKIQPYTPYPFSVTDYIAYDNLEENYYDPMSVELVKRIVKAESPISEEALRNYFRKAYGIKQIGSKANTIITNQIANARVKRSEDYRQKTFYWDPEKEMKVDCFRSSGRDILQIPKEEIIFLMNQIISLYQNIDKEDLIRQTAQHMKFDTVSSRIRGKLEYTLNYAIQNQLLVKGYQESYHSS